jgi:hypothetical protein
MRVGVCREREGAHSRDLLDPASFLFAMMTVTSLGGGPFGSLLRFCV